MGGPVHTLCNGRLLGEGAAPTCVPASGWLSAPTASPGTVPMVVGLQADFELCLTEWTTKEMRKSFWQILFMNKIITAL